MAYDYRIIPDQNLLLITGSGSITSEDIHRVVVSFQRDPAWQPTMNMLVDWRRVYEVLIELDEIKQLVADALTPERKELGKPLGMRAAVVLSDPDHETIPLLYAGYLRESGLETKIFYRLDRAAEWLGVDSEALQGHA